jgi:hypothetical protein
MTLEQEYNSLCHLLVNPVFAREMETLKETYENKMQSFLAQKEPDEHLRGQLSATNNFLNLFSSLKEQLREKLVLEKQQNP